MVTWPEYSKQNGTPSIQDAGRGSIKSGHLMRTARRGDSKISSDYHNHVKQRHIIKGRFNPEGPALVGHTTEREGND